MKISFLFLVCFSVTFSMLSHAQSVGINTNNPGSELSVKGGLAVGTNYSESAPVNATNGAIIEGNVGIGTVQLQVKLEVNGVVRASSLAGTGTGIVTTNASGDLNRLNFSGNNADVLKGDGTWGASSGGGGTAYLSNMYFPDGLTGISPIIFTNLISAPYTVPLGKNLYITNIFNISSGSLFVDGIALARSTFNFYNSSNGLHLESPIIVGAGSLVNSDYAQLAINGFLVNANVLPLTKSNLFTTPYTVPAGKIFVITNIHNISSNELTINGISMSRYFFNYMNSGNGQVLGIPLLAGAGMIVAAQGDNVYINGYLRDQ